MQLVNCMQMLAILIAGLGDSLNVVHVLFIQD